MIALDVETYPNFNLIVIGKKEWHTTGFYSLQQRQAILRALRLNVTYGFNSLNYDIPIITMALNGVPVETLYLASKFIIEEGAPHWQTYYKFGIDQQIAGLNHVDIKEVAPAVMISLKMYGARMHMKELRDLPYDPHVALNKKQQAEIIKYCFNDIATTEELYRQIKPRVDLREGMSLGIDVRSKSDAQVAEAMIKHAVNGKVKKLPSKPVVRYTPPDYIVAKGSSLQTAISYVTHHRFRLKKGKLVLPPDIPKVHIGGMTYKFGIGGIHSTEKSQTIIPTENEILADRDAAGYYPNIIVNLGLFPPGVGEGFLEAYRKPVIQRDENKKIIAELKRTGESPKTWARLDADNAGYKIMSNGSYGKFGSLYSFLYAPQLMLQTTLTGQLALLMLIERLHLVGIKVVSANTDGFVSLMTRDKYQRYDAICFNWELDTDFTLEETQYRSLHSRDVNNYVAITTDGKIKGKGDYAETSLMKSPRGSILGEAVKQHLLTGASIGTMIRECEDLTKFIVVRQVRGGAAGGLGKVVRWYYGTDGEAIRYASNGNKVATSDGAVPVMTLPDEFPDDIDYDKYIALAQKMLKQLGEKNVN